MASGYPGMAGQMAGLVSQYAKLRQGQKQPQAPGKPVSNQSVGKLKNASNVIKSPQAGALRGMFSPTSAPASGLKPPQLPPNIQQIAGMPPGAGGQAPIGMPPASSQIRVGAPVSVSGGPQPIGMPPSAQPISPDGSPQINPMDASKDTQGNPAISPSGTQQFPPGDARNDQSAMDIWKNQGSPGALPGQGGGDNSGGIQGGMDALKRMYDSAQSAQGANGGQSFNGMNPSINAPVNDQPIQPIRGNDTPDTSKPQGIIGRGGNFQAAGPGKYGGMGKPGMTPGIVPNKPIALPDATPPSDLEQFPTITPGGSFMDRINMAQQGGNQGGAAIQRSPFRNNRMAY